MRHTILAVVPLLLVAACSDQPVTPTSPGVAPAPVAQAAHGPIVHRVSVGGPDICGSPQVGSKPGCDANFSLIATQWEDGSATGQLIDQYGEPGGLHATVDCLLVQVIPGRTTLEAWIGGVVTRPTSQAGQRVITRVRDNGTSMKDPLPDAIGRAIVAPEEEGFSSDCHDKATMGLARTPQGQVTIW